MGTRIFNGKLIFSDGTIQETAVSGGGAGVPPPTANSDFLVGVASPAAWAKKTLADTLFILGKAQANGLASLDANGKVVQQPASITDHLGGTPTNQTFGDTASEGALLTASRSDHKHGMPDAEAVEDIIGAILTDTGDVDLIYDDINNQIRANVVGLVGTISLRPAQAGSVVGTLSITGSEIYLYGATGIPLKLAGGGGEGGELKLIGPISGQGNWVDSANWQHTLGEIHPQHSASVIGSSADPWNHAYFRYITMKDSIYPYPTVQFAKGDVDKWNDASTDEHVQDIVANLIQDGGGIGWTYDDVSGTLTPSIGCTQSTPSRSLGTTYQNSDTVARTVSVSVLCTGSGTCKALVEDADPPTVRVAMVYNVPPNAGVCLSMSFKVPPGWHYKVIEDTQSVSLTDWAEWAEQ